jgi:hypothetical protein
MKAILELLKGKKTYATGLVGVLVMLIDRFNLYDLDITVGEQVMIWLGSIGALTLRAALAKVGN